MKKILFQEKTQLFKVAVILVFSTVAGTCFQFIMAEFIDVAVSGSAEMVLQMLIFAFLFLILMLCLEYIFQKMKKHIVCDWCQKLRENIFSNIFEKGIGAFEQKNSAVYLNSLLSDCDMLEEVYFTNTLKLMQVIMELLITSVAVLLVSPFMFVVMLVMTFFTMLLVNVGKERVEYGMAAVAESRETYSVFLKEQFWGYRLIRMFQMKTKVLANHSQKCREMEEKKYVQQLLMLQKNYLAEFIGFGSTLVIMALAAYLALKGKVSAGFVLVSGQLVGKITYPIMTLPEIMMNYRAANPIIKRMGEYGYENSHNSVSESGKRKGIEIQQINRVSLKNVSFVYPESEASALSGIDFSFESGKKYLIIGESGCGKSTLLQLLANFFPDYQGEACMNDMSFKAYEEESIYRKLGFMTQNVLLFEDTLRNNLALYRSFADEEIINALQLAGFTDFTEIFKEGLDSVIKENGGNLSGGEKQRIALARVLLHNFSWLLFDEFTANLDTETALRIEKQLLTVEDKTIITVSHRLNREIVKMYDEILVLDKGRIAEHGSYEKLLEAKNYFYAIAVLNGW